MVRAGGWKGDSIPAEAVIVQRRPNGEHETIPVNPPKIMNRNAADATLEANDLLYVPGSTGARSASAAVKGVGGASKYEIGYLITRWKTACTVTIVMAF